MYDRLTKFAALVDAGSFTKAAAELHLSQPALSTAIAKLERELKARLLVRASRQLTLTTAGKLAYQAAKDLSIKTDNLKLHLAELAHEQVNLKIGMIDSIADTLFSGDVGLELLESGKLSVAVNNSRILLEAVERGDLDIAFVAEQHGHLPAVLEARNVAIEPLVVVTRTDQPAPPGKLLPRFIAYDQPSNTFRLVAEALKNYGVTPQIAFYSTSPEVILRLTLLGKGTAALPYLMVRRHLANGELKRLGGKTPWLVERNIIAIKRRDRELPLPLRQLTHQTASLLNGLMAGASNQNQEVKSK
jgi:DNA-binding transcriptional LysR family regulator